MSVQLPSVIKTYVETGDKPSAAEMVHLVDSLANYNPSIWTSFSADVLGFVPKQPHMSAKRIMMVIPAADGTSPTLIGISALSTTGAITSPAAFSNADYRQQAVRLLYRSTASAGQTASWRSNNSSYFWRGNAAGQGGFTISFKFAIPVQPSGYIFFAGIKSSSAAIGATTEASALTDCCGIGKDSGDTNLQFLHNDNVSTCTKEDTTIAPATDTMYQLILHCEGNAGVIYFVLVNLNTGALVKAWTSTSSNLPLTGATSASIMRPIQHISNNAQATAVDCESGIFYAEAFN